MKIMVPVLRAIGNLECNPIAQTTVVHRMRERKRSIQ